VTSYSLAQRSPTDCGVSSKCNHEAPEGETITRNRFEALQKKKKHFKSIGTLLDMSVNCGLLLCMAVST